MVAKESGRNAGGGRGKGEDPRKFHIIPRDFPESRNGRFESRTDPGMIRNPA